jgi:hypothetical protein
MCKSKPPPNLSKTRAERFYYESCQRKKPKITCWYMACSTPANLLMTQNTYIPFSGVGAFNPLPLFKSLLPGQEDRVFFSGHLNLHAKRETGIPYRGKNYNN